jgi:clathrin heavy chain
VFVTHIRDALISCAVELTSRLLQTLESDSYICIREKKNETAAAEIVIVDLKNGNNVVRRPIKADSAIMHWSRQVIALRAQSRTVQIFDLDKKAKLKSATMNEDVVFWKWVSETTLGLVTETAVFHWDVFDATQANPVEMFKRNANLSVRILKSVQVTARLI